MQPEAARASKKRAEPVKEISFFMKLIIGRYKVMPGINQSQFSFSRPTGQNKLNMRQVTGKLRDRRCEGEKV